MTTSMSEFIRAWWRAHEPTTPTARTSSRALAHAAMAPTTVSYSAERASSTTVASMGAGSRSGAEGQLELDDPRGAGAVTVEVDLAELAGGGLAGGGGPGVQGGEAGVEVGVAVEDRGGGAGDRREPPGDGIARSHR